MIINDQARRLVMESEGLRLTPYKCPAGVWTVGYGHTGKDVVPGRAITVEHAEELLEFDLLKFETGVFKLAPKSTGPQHSAMVSLAFNIGLDAFAKSTLLKLHLAGHHLSAGEQFLKWTHAAGKVLPGLVKRRAAERAIYLTVES